MPFCFQIHRDERPYSCNLCDMQFKHKNSLVRHKFRHSGQKPFKCQSCHKSFASSDNLKEHNRRIHTKESSDSGVSSPALVALPQVSFQQPTYLLQWNPHTGQPVAQPVYTTTNGLMGFGAPVGTDVFPTAFTVLPPQPPRPLLHIKEEEAANRPAISANCPEAEVIDLSGDDEDFPGESVRGGDELMGIAMREIVGEQELVCDVCGQKLKTARALTVHQRRRHGNKNL